MQIYVNGYDCEKQPENMLLKQKLAPRFEPLTIWLTADTKTTEP